MPYIKDVSVNQEIPARSLDWAGYFKETIGLIEVFKRFFIYTDPYNLGKRAVFMLVKEEGYTIRCVHNDFFKEG